MKQLGPYTLNEGFNDSGHLKEGALYVLTKDTFDNDGKLIAKAGLRHYLIVYFYQTESDVNYIRFDGTKQIDGVNNSVRVFGWKIEKAIKDGEWKYVKNKFETPEYLKHVKEIDELKKILQKHREKNGKSMHVAVGPVHHETLSKDMQYGSVSLGLGTGYQASRGSVIEINYDSGWELAWYLPEDIMKAFNMKEKRGQKIKFSSVSSIKSYLDKHADIIDASDEKVPYPPSPDPYGYDRGPHAYHGD